MAKLTKNQLKTIVKECLVEILAEGLGQTNDIMVETTSKRPSRAKRAASPVQKRTLL